MIIALIFVNIIFLAIAKYINTENAKFFLAGYNTMSEKERNNFDLVSYLKFFKSFFIKLTFYSTLIFAVTYFFYYEEIAAIAWCLSLTVPWPYFIIKSQKYSK
tara:strand:- start:440 stop:748 length:309 start_codon:yes stop_codon:yes gene_type:complete